MKSKTAGRLILLVLVSAGPIFFQNCTVKNEPNEELQKTTKSENGTIFEGKPNGYVHQEPGFECEGRSAVRAQLEKIGDDYYFTLNSREKCKVIDRKLVVYRQLDASAIQADYLGYNRFIFENVTAETELETSYVESYCKADPQGSGVEFDIVARVDNKSNSSSIQILSKSNPVKSLSAVRTVTASTVLYSNPEVILKVDRKASASTGQDFSAVAVIRENAISRSQNLICRVASFPVIAGPLSDTNYCLGKTTGAVAGGTGTAQDPAMLCTAQQFQNYIRNGELEYHARLMADIDLAGVILEPKGNELNPHILSFDGNNHIISNFRLNAGGNYVGLFGKVTGANFGLRNLLLFNPQITAPGSQYVGALVGSGTDLTIMGVDVFVGSVTGKSHTGAIAGQLSGQLLDSRSSADVTAVADISGTLGYVGGLIGMSQSKIQILRSVVRANIKTQNAGQSIGGLIGKILGPSSIYFSSFSGILGSEGILTQDVGGIVGNIQTSTCNIHQSFTEAEIRGTNNVGGIIGKFSESPNALFASTVVSSYSRSRVIATGEGAGGIIGSVESRDPSKAYISVNGVYFANTIVGKSGVGAIIGFAPIRASFTLYRSAFDSSLAPVEAVGTIAAVTGATGFPTPQMQNPDTFLGLGWWETIWKLTPNEYPTLIQAKD